MIDTFTRRVERLEEEAGAAGDLGAVVLCRLALGTQTARRLRQTPGPLGAAARETLRGFWTRARAREACARMLDAAHAAKD